jgi:hypothetical protein
MESASECPHRHASQTASPTPHGDDLNWRWSTRQPRLARYAGTSDDGGAKSKWDAKLDFPDGTWLRADPEATKLPVTMLRKELDVATRPETDVNFSVVPGDS